MTVSLGVHVGQQAMSMADLRSLWRRLDDAGVDWISVWDHLYEAPPAGGTIDHFEALSTLGALVADTSRARLGCLVFCVLYRNPSSEEHTSELQSLMGIPYSVFSLTKK